MCRSLRWMTAAVEEAELEQMYKNNPGRKTSSRLTA